MQYKSLINLLFTQLNVNLTLSNLLPLNLLIHKILRMKNNVLKVLFFVFISFMTSCSPEDGIDGQIGKDGKDGTNGINGADGTDGTDGTNGGVTYLILTGSITNEEALAKIEEKVGVNTQFILINNTTKLTAVNLSSIEEVVNIEIRNNNVLASVELPKLTTLVGELYVNSNPQLQTLSIPIVSSIYDLNISNNPLLSSVNIPVLKEITAIAINNNKDLTTILFPTLETVINSLDSKIQITQNKNLESISFPRLAIVSEIVINSNNNLLDLDFDALELTSTISILQNPLIPSIALPSLDRVYSLDLDNNTSLTSITANTMIAANAIRIRNNSSLGTIDFSRLEVLNHISLFKTNLTSMNLPSLKKIGNNTINLDFFNDDLITVINPDDTKIGLGSLRLEQNNELETLSFPLLSEMDQIDIHIENNTKLDAITLVAPMSSLVNLTVITNPKLRVLDLSTSTISYDIHISRNELLDTIDFSSLKEIRSTYEFNSNPILYIGENPALINLTFPKLERIETKATINGNSALNTIAFPLLQKAIEIELFENKVLTSVTFAKLSDFENLNIFLAIGNTMPSQLVNDLLAQLVAITPAITQKNIQIEAIPTGQGEIDKQTLIDNGNNVITL